MDRSVYQALLEMSQRYERNDEETEYPGNKSHDEEQRASYDVLDT